MISPLFWPHVGGVEKHVKKVSEELIKQGHEVTILTKRHDGSLPDFSVKDGIRIVRFQEKNYVQNLAWIYENRQLFERADIIHCHDFSTFTSWYLPFRIFYPYRPVYVTFHGHEGKVPIPYKTLVLRKITERLTLGNICIGDFIPKWYGTKADFILYGGTDKVDGNAPEDKQGAAFIGRLERDTGILTYIEALRILKEEGVDLELDICGDGSLRDRISDRSMKYGLRVTIHGMVDDPWQLVEKRRFAFVTGYLSILEAMARKKLVFAVCEDELKSDYLRMMPCAEDMMEIASSADALARRIKYHCSNLSDNSRMVTKAYAFAQENTWKDVADTYLRLWRVRADD